MTKNSQNIEKIKAHLDESFSNFLNSYKNVPSYEEHLQYIKIRENEINLLYFTLNKKGKIPPGEHKANISYQEISSVNSSGYHTTLKKFNKLLPSNQINHSNHIVTINRNQLAVKRYYQKLLYNGSISDIEHEANIKYQQDNEYNIAGFEASIYKYDSQQKLI